MFLIFYIGLFKPPNMDKEQTSRRRHFLKTTLALGATAFINPVGAIASVPERAEEFAITVGPYLQTNFGNEMTILWITNKKSLLVN